MSLVAAHSAREELFSTVTALRAHIDGVACRLFGVGRNAFVLNSSDPAPGPDWSFRLVKWEAGGTVKPRSVMMLSASGAT